MANEAKYRRIVLKLSGEALAGEKGYGIDPNVVNSIARQIKEEIENKLSYHGTIKVTVVRETRAVEVAK